MRVIATLLFSLLLAGLAPASLAQTTKVAIQPPAPAGFTPGQKWSARQLGGTITMEILSIGQAGGTAKLVILGWGRQSFAGGGNTYTSSLTLHEGGAEISYTNRNSRAEIFRIRGRFEGGEFVVAQGAIFNAASVGKSYVAEEMRFSR